MAITNPDTAAAPKIPQLPEELIASTTFLLKRLGFAAKERTMKAYEGTGLHPYHHAILLVLDERSRETQGSIADALGFDRGQLVGLLDELEERALLERERDPNDRRRHVVRLTPEGKRVLRRLRTIAREIDDDFLSPLSDQDRANLHALLPAATRCHGVGPRHVEGRPRGARRQRELLLRGEILLPRHRGLDGVATEPVRDREGGRGKQRRQSDGEYQKNRNAAPLHRTPSGTRESRVGRQSHDSGDKVGVIVGHHHRDRVCPTQAAADRFTAHVVSRSRLASHLSAADPSSSFARS